MPATGCVDVDVDTLGLAGSETEAVMSGMVTGRRLCANRHACTDDLCK